MEPAILEQFELLKKELRDNIAEQVHAEFERSRQHEHRRKKQAQQERPAGERLYLPAILGLLGILLVCVINQSFSISNQLGDFKAAVGARASATESKLDVFKMEMNGKMDNLTSKVADINTRLDTMENNINKVQATMECLVRKNK